MVETSHGDAPEVPEEDRKLVTLARSARARTGAATGAALRDETGRTYVGVDVALPSLRLSALELCVAQAVVGGSTGVEAAVVVTTARAGSDTAGSDPAATDLAGPNLAALADLGGAGVPVLIADGRGEVVRIVST